MLAILAWAVSNVAFAQGAAPAPAPLEFALRYAFVDPDAEVDRDWREELTACANRFFAGHDNKLSADTSHISLQQPGAEDLTEWRVRLQWDVSS